MGGELYATYNKKNFWGNDPALVWRTSEVLASCLAAWLPLQEKCGKFYVAGTVFAFEHLHSKKIIFRDLKPAPAPKRERQRLPAESKKELLPSPV